MQRLFSQVTPFLPGQIFISTPFSLPTGTSIASPLQMAFGAQGLVEQDQITGSCRSDQPGILLFQHSDNPNPNIALFWESIGAFSVVPNLLLSIPMVTVRKLYWRFIYQNTAPITGPNSVIFELDINGFNSAPAATDMYGNSRSQVIDSYYTS